MAVSSKASRLSPWVHATAVVEGLLGEGTRVGPNAYVGPDVVTGDGCVIGPGAVVGCSGFGFEFEQDRWRHKPERFGVELGEEVWIGAQVCIARGSWRDTKIMSGCRIDNLVHIAHNVILRRHVMVVAQAMLAGSVEVGEGAWIGPSASVIQRLSIGRRALVGMGAVVINDVASDTTVAGNPARVVNDKVGVREEM